MCTPKTLLSLAFAAFASTVAFAQGFGTPISEKEIAAWDISIMPDGSGLPPGSGTPEQGAQIYAAKCALCHGPEARGGTNAALVGGAPLTTGIDTPKTIANFWPYATTLFDYINRAMPFAAPGTLPADDVYAVVAYLLAENGVIERSAVMNRRTLPQVRMPARDRFVPDDRTGGAVFK